MLLEDGEARWGRLGVGELGAYLNTLICVSVAYSLLLHKNGATPEPQFRVEGLEAFATIGTGFGVQYARIPLRVQVPKEF